MTEEELLKVIEQAATEEATELDLSGQELTALPPEIGNLTQLKKLILGKYEYDEDGNIVDTIGNKLSYLPKEIGLLNQLEEFQIVTNQLSSLPAEIGELSNLQSLYLNSNQLSSLPADIKTLTKLEKLDLRGNPVPIPPEILGAKELWEDPGDVKEILDFYFRVQDPNETEPLYEAKFLIIGEGGAGKTSLAKKIEDENYKLKSDEKSTEGIDVIQWKFPLENGRDFRVNIWDLVLGNRNQGFL